MKSFITKNKYFRGFAILLFWLLVWQAASSAVASTVVLPSPITTFKVLLELVVQAKFWQTVFFSLLRIICGFAAALIIGCALAVLTAKSRFFKALFSPILHTIKATPVASFIIIMLIWLPNDAIPIWVSALMVLPLIWSNVEKGILMINPEYMEMANVFRLGKMQILQNIIIPSVMPYFMAGATTAMGMAWKAGVAAEVLCTPKAAIGSMLYNAKVYLETPSLFAWTVVVILLSILVERLFVTLMRRSGHKYHKAEAEK